MCPYFSLFFFFFSTELDALANNHETISRKYNVLQSSTCSCAPLSLEYFRDTMRNVRL
ncbi:hypothetical protein RchiOBHm_Chr1g0351151 [Rosa chinensis]|uniref:Secreted protein n=1 Tax=Rosa chinensis TaxID=74649 RepID=A0A2P6SG83_ROSCH|nr:hypothetical protein RchiOBHm_Chr1g0351151 [Rosa chinensis]